MTNASIHLRNSKFGISGGTGRSSIIFVVCQRALLSKAELCDKIRANLNPDESELNRPSKCLSSLLIREHPWFLRRKEVIQPQVPLRLPCYDFIPITSHTFGICPLAVGTMTSGTAGFHDVTGGVYKAWERIHGAVADAPLLAIPAS
jgi:hypothetical protein